MARFVFCAKLHKELEGLVQPPFLNEIGTKIYEHISKEAWQMWLQHQTLLINEYRLSMIDPKSRAFLMQEMNKFLFGEGSDKPTGYQPKE